MSQHLTSEELASFLDGTLSSVERSDCEKHLAQCDHCLSELVDLREIQEKIERVPGEFINKARGEVEPLGRRWPWYLAETAAMFMVTAVLAYLFFYKPGSFMPGKASGDKKADASKMERAAAPSPKEKEVFDRKMDYDKVAERQRAKGYVSEMERSDNMKKLSSQTVSEQKTLEGRVESERIQKMKDEETARIGKEEATRNQLANQQGFQNIDNVQAKRVGPSATNVQSKRLGSTATNAPLQKVRQKNQPPAVTRCFDVSGDAGLSDILNPEIVCDQSQTIRPRENVVVLLEVDSSGVVVRAQPAEAPSVDEVKPYLERALRLRFKPAPQGLRKARLVFFKTGQT